MNRHMKRKGNFFATWMQNCVPVFLFNSLGLYCLITLTFLTFENYMSNNVKTSYAIVKDR